MRDTTDKRGTPQASTYDVPLQSLRRDDDSLSSRILPGQQRLVNFRPTRAISCDGCQDNCEYCRARPNPHGTYAGIIDEPGEAGEYYDRLNP